MPPPISILFCGTSAFAVPSLEALLADEVFAVQLVVTQPDRPAGRKQILTPPPVKLVAEKHGIPILQPEKINAEVSRLASRVSRPDFLVVVSFGQILSQAILDFPTRMPVNVHASLLPRFRGASPIQHAILDGDTVSGVTVQRIVKELDAGPILAQERLKIPPRATFESLHDQLAPLGARLLLQTLKNPIQEEPQDESELVFCRRLTREDGIADTNTQTAAEIDRKVRALNPWPGVTIMLDGQPLKLLETAMEDSHDAYPLPCRAGSTLYLLSVQPAGKNPMSGAAWRRGKRIESEKS
jgi:methionyl-tRNA formyltransferase